MLNISKYQQETNIDQISLEEIIVSIEGIKDRIIKLINWLKEKIKLFLDNIFKRDTVKKLEKENLTVEARISKAADALKDNAVEISLLKDKFDKANLSEEKIKRKLTSEIFKNKSLSDKLDLIENKKYQIDAIVEIDKFILENSNVSGKHEINVFNISDIYWFVHDKCMNKLQDQKYITEFNNDYNLSRESNNSLDIRVLSDKESFVSLNRNIWNTNIQQFNEFKHQIQKSFEKALQEENKILNSFKIDENLDNETSKTIIETKNRISFLQNNFVICEKILNVYIRAVSFIREL